MEQKQNKFISFFSNAWSPFRVTVILGVLAAYYFGITGTFWAVTGEFTRWGGSILQLFGINTKHFVYLKMIHFQGTPLTRVDGVMILGMFLGAFIAAIISNNVKLRLPTSWVRVFQALFGGMMAGFGARLAMGCNLAAFFTGIPQFSLHAWFFTIFTALGTYIGTKVIKLPLFQTHAKLTKNTNGKSSYHLPNYVNSAYKRIMHYLLFAFAIILIVLLMWGSFAKTELLGLATIFGLTFGFLLEKGQVCFTSAFRDLWIAGRTTMIDGILAGMAIGTIGTFAYIKLGMPAKIFWAGPNAMIGGLIFGIGIVVAGGCETGWMYRSMEGQIHFWIVGLGNILGSILLVYTWKYLAPILVYKFPKVNLLKQFGDMGGLVITFTLLLLCFIFTSIWKYRFFKKDSEKEGLIQNGQD